MNLVKVNDKVEGALQSHLWIEDQVFQSKYSSCYLPAGNTPIELYKLWENENPSFISSLKLIQIDDVVTGIKSGVFKKFFKEHLPSFVNQFQWIEDKEQVQADLSILGLGLNGHVAFHEPEIAASFSFGEVELSEKTKETLDLEDSAKGLTYGVGSFVKSKAVLMMVFGEGKREILKCLINEDPSIPASGLMAHPDFTIITDLEI